MIGIGTGSSGDNSISTEFMRAIVDKLQAERFRSSTKLTYYRVWKKFNEFYISLDEKPVLLREKHSASKVL